MLNKKKLGMMFLTLSAATLIAACSPTNKDNDDGGGSNASGKDFVANKAGSFLVGKDGLVTDDKIAKETPIVDIYFDPMCPGCGEFENATGAYTKEQVENGTILVRYHPLSFLDASSTDNYSTRMSAYILGVSNHASPLVLDFMAKVFSPEIMPKQGAEYVPFTDAGFEQVFISVGGTKEQADKISKDMESNMEKAYRHTLDVISDSALIRKSPTGALFTPFVIPNHAGEDGSSAIMFGLDMLTQYKEMVEEISK